MRAYWSGSKFYSRNGNEFIAPKWFVAELPKVPLDGELWAGRGMFQSVVGFTKVKKTTDASDENWKFITYLVFDAPSHKGPFEERYAWLKSNIDATSPGSYAAVVGHELCKGKDHLMTELKKVLDLGGEGLMLRQPNSKYQQGRNKTLLKVKVFHDEEALVLSHEKGNGRLAGMMGKLHVQLANGIKFKIGTGFSDAERKSPPKVGSVVTFKFQEVSNSGTPRFPVFLRIRGDLTWKDVLENAKTSQPHSEKKKLSFKLKKAHTLLYTSVPSRDQSTGVKQVTDDDVIEPAVKEPGGGGAAGPTADRPACKYGQLCYQTNEAHLAAFFHEREKEAEKKPSAAKKTGGKKAAAAAASGGEKEPCVYGSACYRTSKDHRDKYSHDIEPAAAPAPALEKKKSTGKGKKKEEEAVGAEEEAGPGSEEEDVPKEQLERAATRAFTAADIIKAVSSGNNKAAAAAAEDVEEDVVVISKKELEKLQALAKQHAAEPVTKKAKK